MTAGKLGRGLLQVVGAATILAVASALVATQFLAPWLQYEDAPGRADYIFPLAGNTSRLVKASELFRTGIAPRLLLSNERVRPQNRAQEVAAAIGYAPPDPEEFRRRFLEHLGVPASEPQSFGRGLYSTLEEAETLKAFLGEKARGTIVLVPSPWQARRAKIIFEHVMPEVRWLVVPPDDGRLQQRWWTDQDAAITVVMEVAKILHYLGGGAFRSTDVEARANSR